MSDDLVPWLRKEADEWETFGEDFTAGLRSPTAANLRKAADRIEALERRPPLPTDLLARAEAAERVANKMTDLYHAAEACAERLERALERLASPEAFISARMANEEETARMHFAQAALNQEKTDADDG